MITNWIYKIDFKSSAIREKPKKESKHQRHEWYEIRVKITQIKHQVYYVMVTEVVNLREIIIIDEEIIIANDYILKIA